MDNFNEDMLQRYKDGTATEEEREEFLRLLKAGEFDHLVAFDIHGMLTAEDEAASEDEKKLVAKVNDRIRAVHDIKPRVVSIQERKKPHLWLAAAAVIVMAVVAALWLVPKEKIFPGQITAQQEPVPSVFTGRQVITLPDGSKVILNDNSELSYSTSFGTLNREVSLTGEASFDVAHDVSKPFIVHTGKVETKVLGTAFNINAYSGQQVTVTVIRGLVQVGDDRQVYARINPDEQIVVDVSSHAFTTKNTKAEAALAWQSNFLIMRDVTLQEAANTIAAKFNVQVTFGNDALKACRFDGTFLNDESLEDVLAMMSTVVNMRYTIAEAGNVMLDGKGCN